MEKTHQIQTLQVDRILRLPLLCDVVQSQMKMLRLEIACDRGSQAIS